MVFALVEGVGILFGESGNFNPDAPNLACSGLNHLPFR